MDPEITIFFEKFIIICTSCKYTQPKQICANTVELYECYKLQDW
jgi:hypothetical protein